MVVCCSDLFPRTMTSTNGETAATQADKNVEMWRIKKLIKSLEAARGYGRFF